MATLSRHIFFAKGDTMTKEVYLKALQTAVKPWMDEIAGGEPYHFQQNGASANTSTLVQKWLEANVPMFWPKDTLPPRGSDVNPVDYYVWACVERASNRYQYIDTAYLPEAIKAAFRYIPRDALKEACGQFKARLGAVIEAGGKFVS